MLNLHGMLRAPAEPVPAPVFVATYSNGFGFERKEITAPNRFSAYAKAKVYMPDGCTLTHLRQKKSTNKFTGPVTDDDYLHMANE